MFCNLIHHSISEQYPSIFLCKSWSRSEYKPLHHHYLKKRDNFCFILEIFIYIVIIFCSMKEYSKLHWCINYWPIIFKVGHTAFKLNFLSAFTYYITQTFFSWNLSNNSFNITQFLAKWVILLWQKGLCLFFNDISTNAIINYSSSNILGDLFWWQEIHAIVPVIFNRKMMRKIFKNGSIW